MPLKLEESQELGLKTSDLSIQELCVEVKKASDDFAEHIQKEQAEILVETIATAYWQKLNSEKGCSFLLNSYASKKLLETLSGSANQIATQIGHKLSDFEVESAAYQLGNIYTSLLPPSYRSRLGVFYTPPALANRLLDQAERCGVDWGSAKILDPASGGGSFLVSAIIRALTALEGSNPLIILKNIEARVHGWELDSFAVWLSSVFIKTACLDVSVLAKKLVKPNITHKNSIEAKLSRTRFDLVVGNPPFGRQKLSDELRERYKNGLYGHANIYGVFTQLAVSLTKSDGLVSFLTPASYLAGEYFKNLRKLLTTDTTPLNLDIVESRKGVFEGVLQETVLATYKKGSSEAKLEVAVIEPTEGGGLNIAGLGGQKLPRSSSAPWILARQVEDDDLACRLNRMPFRLSDWGYKISTGPLVWNRYKDQLKDRPGKNRIPLIWSESIRPNGDFEFRYQKKNHKPFFKLTKEKDDWLVVTKSCVLIQRTTSKEQSKRLIAAELPIELIERYGAVTVENHVNMLVPIGDEPKVPARVVAAFLNSYAADRAFRCISGSVAVSAYELGSMPMPDPAELSVLKGLITRGASKESVDKACKKLYGMSIAI